MTASVKELRRSFARELLAMPPGSPLPPIRSLAERSGASVGAAQRALASLASDGAVVLDSRPGRGGILVTRDIGLLYRALESGPLLVSLSLPSTERIHGLATAIKELLGLGGLESYLVFTRGSRPRLDSLRQGRSHMTVVSALAADILCPPDLEAPLVLAPGTFVREHRVYFVEGREPNGRRRVAVDHSSLDFERLTQLEFEGQDVDFVGLNYLTAIREMMAGTVDEVILDVDDALMRFPSSIGSRPLSDSVRASLDHANTRAAFVCRCDDAVVRTIVRECLDPARIAAIQRDVVAGARAPEF